MLIFDRPILQGGSRAEDVRDPPHFLGIPGFPGHLGMRASPGLSSASTALEDYSEQKCLARVCCWYCPKHYARCAYYPHARGARVYQDKQFNGL